MNRFTPTRRASVDSLIRTARAAEARGQFSSALGLLEQAHVLGQRSTALHVRVHLQMFGLAWRNGWAGEALGQGWRVLAAALATPFGLVPAGNPGSTRVSGFRRQPVAPALQRLLDATR